MFEITYTTHTYVCIYIPIFFINLRCLIKTTDKHSSLEYLKN